ICGQVFFFALINMRSYVLDFQDCEKHFFINDLAVFIYFSLEQTVAVHDLRAYGHRLITSLLEGYNLTRPLDSFWIEKIPLFMKLREILAFIICFCYWDLSGLREQQKILLQFYRKNIEFDVTVLPISFP
ncbi:hypothetical protein ACFL27_25935, partial [candidate division CSSED10-310 bacterium]